MTNHVHLLFEVSADEMLSQFMHRLANVFAKRFNAIRERKGHLWEGRFVSTIVEAPSYFLRCMAYIDLNPVRAKIVANPADYPWCGHRAVVAEDQSLITLHELYRELGGDPASRKQTYLQLLEAEASRSPYSLAGVLFVGRNDFVDGLRKRFGLAETEKRPRMRQVELGDGIQAVHLQGGGSRSRCLAP